MKTLTERPVVRRVLAGLLPGALVLQGGCPVDVAGLITRELTQVFTDTVFFVVESALIRAL